MLQQHAARRLVPNPRREAQGGGTVAALGVDVSARVAVVPEQRLHRGNVRMRIGRPHRRLHERGRAAVAALRAAGVRVRALLQQEANQLGAAFSCRPQ
jgi:hypothetical protein